MVGWILLRLLPLPGWPPTVWLGCAVVLVQAPGLALVPELAQELGLAQVQELGPVPVLGARPLLGLLQLGLLRSGLF